ncbi:MAG TPA: hypothetical protein VLR90_06985 [Blastocatellia bacterium]|nr:hypothetical protein [Blastocatellia bacterium]
MAKNPNAMNNDFPSEVAVKRSADRDEIRQALLRLRQLGEKLPPVDAAMVIREGRDMANKSSEQ